MPAPAKKPPAAFDHAKLSTMVEPLTVRVEKLRGTQGQPVELPPKEGSLPGTGLTREDALKIEGIVLGLTGGGTYKGSIVDASGDKMDWLFGWNPQQYPEKSNPADVQAYGVPPAVGTTPTPLGGAAPSGWPPPGWNYTYAAPPAPPNFGVPQTQWSGAANSWMPPSWAGYPPPSWAMPQPPAALDSRIERLQDENRRQEQLRQEERHRYEQDQLARTHEAQLAALRDELRALRETKPAGPSDETRALRDELARERDERRRTEEKLERQRELDQHRHELKEMNEKFERTLSQMGQQSQSTPLVELIRTNMSVVQSQMDKLAGLTMNPVQLLDAMHRSGSGADAVLKNVVDAMGGAFQTYRTALEQIAQIAGQGPEHPAIPVVRDIGSGVKDILKRFVDSRQRTEIEQARAVQAQAHAQVVQAQVVAAQQAGLAGANGTPQPAVIAAAPATVAAARAPAPPPSHEAQQQPSGRPTDDELFAQAIDQVKRLRLAVRNGATPEFVCEKIEEGAQIIEAKKLVVPAYQLYVDRQYADFLEALLPNAPQALKDRCAEIFAEDDRAGDEEEAEAQAAH